MTSTSTADQGTGGVPWQRGGDGATGAVGGGPAAAGGLLSVPHQPVQVTLTADGSADRLLLVPRAIVGMAAVASMPLVPTVWPPGTGLTGGYLLAVSGLTMIALRRRSGAAGLRRLAAAVLGADALACLAVLVLLGGTPHGAGMVLFPLLAFEATLKYGGPGLLISLVGLLAGIGGRMSWRLWHYGLPPRWHVALLVVAATGVLVGLAFALRTRCAAESGARAERDRIAASLRATVTELLARSGVPRNGIAYADLTVLIDLACDRPELGRELGRRLATTLEPAPQLGRLTGREREILRLLAGGLSDRQVAARLFLSDGTVRVHVSNIVHKLGVPNRAAALQVQRSGGQRSGS